MVIVIWFLVICSIVVHGLSIPLGKLGFFLPRTISRAWTSQTTEETGFAIGERVASNALGGVLRRRGRESRRESRKESRSATRENEAENGSAGAVGRQIYKIGGRVIRDNGEGSSGGSGVASGATASTPVERSIRFPDETSSPAGTEAQKTL